MLDSMVSVCFLFCGLLILFLFLLFFSVPFMKFLDQSLQEE